MKHIISTALKQLFADKQLLALASLLCAGGVIYIIYVAFSLHASDLQLATRYTSFGGTHYYRDKWYYLLSFIGMGILFIITHVGMMTKLLVSDMRPLAVAFGWSGLIILMIMFNYTSHVLSIAYLH